VIPLQTTNEQALSFGIQTIDQKYPGFKPGNFTVLHGHPFCRNLIFKLCVHSQLSKQDGGLNSSTIYIDGGNTFNPYTISTLAQESNLNPKSTLEKVFVSRAFTAYQLSAIILKTLKDALKRYKSKLILISNITDLFLDNDVPTKEAFEIFDNMTSHLTELAHKQKIIIIATHPNNSEHSKRQNILESILLEKAHIVARVAETKGRLQLTIYDRDYSESFKADFLQSKAMLEKFLEA